MGPSEDNISIMETLISEPRHLKSGTALLKSFIYFIIKISFPIAIQILTQNALNVYVLVWIKRNCIYWGTIFILFSFGNNQNKIKKYKKIIQNSK